MKLSSKFSIAIIIVVIVAFACSGLLILQNRRSNLLSGENKQGQTNIEEKVSSGEENGDMPEEAAPEVINDDLLQDDQFLQITSQDCGNGCKEYTEKEDLDYCKQICGLSEANARTGGCDKLEDLDKDYCYKDLAINTKDLKICGEIEDSGLKNACVGEITENLSVTQKNN